MRSGRRTGQVSNEGGQFRVGPCCERLAHASVELVLVKPALHKRDLELLGRLLAVGVGCAEVATVPVFSGQLVSRICHRRHLPADLATRLPTARDAWTGVCVSIAAASVLAALLLWQPDDFLAFATALFTAATVLLAPPITAGLMVDARHQKRTGGQLRLEPAPRASG